MAIDAIASARALSGRLFGTSTAILSFNDLVALAAAVDTQMTADISAFTEAMPTTFQSLTSAQQNTLMAYIAMVRAGLT